MNNKSDGHQLLPSAIDSVAGIKPHLCDLALHRGKIYSEQCWQCHSPCKYGIKLLEILGIQLMQRAQELRICDLSRQGEARPTLHQRLRCKGK